MNRIDRVNNLRIVRRDPRSRTGVRKMKGRQGDDAYGQLIWDHYHGLPAPEIIEREHGWIGTSSGPAFYFAEYPAWSEHEREAMKYVRDEMRGVLEGTGWQVERFIPQEGTVHAAVMTKTGSGRKPK